MNTLAPSFFKSTSLILAGKEDMHESLYEFKFRSETTTDSRVIYPCTSEKVMYNVLQHSSASIFDRIFFILAGNENIHNISDEFEILFDQPHSCR